MAFGCGSALAFCSCYCRDTRLARFMILKAHINEKCKHASEVAIALPTASPGRYDKLAERLYMDLSSATIPLMLMNPIGGIMILASSLTAPLSVSYIFMGLGSISCLANGLPFACRRGTISDEDLDALLNEQIPLL